MIKKNIKPQYSNNNLKESDFDGHTEFNSMTFEEKLRWLSEAAESIHVIRSKNKKHLLNRNE